MRQLLCVTALAASALLAACNKAEPEKPTTPATPASVAAPVPDVGLAPTRGFARMIAHEPSAKMGSGFFPHLPRME